jgi:O-antigen/teichoic acid export membrane protein
VVEPDETAIVPVPPSVARRVAGSTGVQALAKVVVFPLGFVSVSLATRHLGERRFGELTTITVYATFLAIVTEWGLTAWSVREFARLEPGEHERTASAVLGLRLVAALVGAVVAIAISFALPYSGVVRVGIAISGVFVLAGTAASACTAVLQTRLRMTPAAVADVLRSVVLVLVMLLAIWAAWGVLGFVAANVVANLSALVIVYLGARRLLKIRVSFDSAIWRAAVASSVALGAALFVHTIYFRVDTLLLSLLRSQVDVGIYGFSYRFYETLLVLPALFTASVLPVIARDLTVPGADLTQALQRSFDFLVLASLPLSIGGILLAPQLTSFLAGRRFADSAVPLAILLAGLVFSSLAALVGTLLIAADRQVTGLVLSLSILIVNVALNLALIPSYGYDAAASLTTASEALVAMVGMVLVGRIYGFRPGLHAALLAATAAALMGGAVWLLRSLPLVLPICTGAVVYGSLILLTGAVSRETLREFLPRRGAG